jgi:hypothetical protein
VYPTYKKQNIPVVLKAARTSERQHETRVDSALITLSLEQITVEEVTPVYNVKR